MKNQENEIAANKRLAELLGWSSIVEVGGALVGTPPPGAAASRGQAMVPDWAGDWAAAAPLLAQFEICPMFMSTYVGAGGIAELYSVCSGLMYPDTNLGENARHGEVFDEQAKTYIFP